MASNDGGIGGGGGGGGVFQVPVSATEEVLEIPLDELPTAGQEFDDLIEVLDSEGCKARQWTTLAREYLQRDETALAIEVLSRGLRAQAVSSDGRQTLPLMAMLASIQLARADALLPRPLGAEAQEDVLPPPATSREELYRQISDLVNQCDRINQKFVPVWLLKGQLHHARNDLDSAAASFSNALKLEPTNLLALLGLAKVNLQRQNWSKASELFKSIIKYRPGFKPDVRVGLGLCFWHMGSKRLARLAWQRSIALDTSNAGALTCLGLDALAVSRTSQNLEERPVHFKKGIEHLQQAFRLRPFQAPSAALALASYFLAAGVPKRAIKLAERAIQTSDHRNTLVDSYLVLAQSHHRQNELEKAFKCYTKTMELSPNHTIASIGTAQILILRNDLLAARNSLENLLNRKPKCVEAMIILGAIYSTPIAGAPSQDFLGHKTMAREMFDRALRYATQEKAAAATNANGELASSNDLTDDEEMFVTMAKLWQDDHPERALRSYQNASRVRKELGQSASPLFLNNIAALEQIRGRFDQAESGYRQALEELKHHALEDDVKDAHQTTIEYNLARVHEQAQKPGAQEEYQAILSRHPEYSDAKARLASILRSKGEKDAAHDLLKQCLLANPKDLNLRSAYIHFLTSVGTLRPAKELAFQTLKDFSKHDIYSLVIAGWIHYVQAREARLPPGDSKAIAAAERDRQTKFYRSVEFYRKALQIDPSCVFAAQGLAIALAENNLGSLTPSTSQKPGEDEAVRVRNLKDAVLILSKVRDSVDDASVQINLGHAYFGTEEWLRSIECYETANRRFLKDSDPNLLMCCARAWHARASAENSYQLMTRALDYAKLTIKSNSEDLIIRYNVAFIQQKCLELVLAAPPAKRSIEDLEKCLKEGQQAKESFEALAKVQEPKAPGEVLPYSIEMAHQRARYGDSLLKNVPEALEAQNEYNDQLNQKLNESRRVRQEAKERDAEAERLRTEAIAKEAKELAAKRKAMKDEASQWAAASEISAEFIGREEEKRGRRSTGKGPKRSRKKSIKEDGEGDLIDDSELGQQGLFGSGDESEDERTKEKANGDGEDVAVSSDNDSNDAGKERPASDDEMNDAKDSLAAPERDEATKRRKDLEKLAKSRAKKEQKAARKRRMTELNGDSTEPVSSTAEQDGESMRKKKRILSAAVIESDDDDD